MESDKSAKFSEGFVVRLGVSIIRLESIIINRVA